MRSKDQIKNHQGTLTVPEARLANRMKSNATRYFTTLQVCQATGCVSARDKIRKLQAAGVPIGPAVLLRTNPNGSRVFGWRIAK